MGVSVKRLSTEYEEKYMTFVTQKKESLMYYSLKYKQFLTELLGDESEYLIAIDDENDEVVGCMPIYFRRDFNGKVVANSLPYYGGHGGPLAKDKKIMELLLQEYLKSVKNRGCSATTVIGSPLEDYHHLYKNIIKPDYIDERIELMTYFPYGTEKTDADALMSVYHYKERNSIRKAIKSGITVEIDNSDETMRFLRQVHTENMLAVGGIPKKRKCFELIQEIFNAGEDYDVFVAKKDGRNVAALLLFYFNGTVEYYTPAVIEEFRTFQPLTLVIYSAMQIAMEKKFEKWNWGGTGLNQKSLYDFKSKWGTTETRYYYYTEIIDEEVLKLDKSELMNGFSNYYVYPFDQV